LEILRLKHGVMDFPSIAARLTAATGSEGMELILPGAN